MDNSEQTVDEEPLEPLSVWVNSGYDRKSYRCIINADSMITLPTGLVRELGLEIGDDIEWSLDEDTFTLYARVIHNSWTPPDWLVD